MASTQADLPQTLPLPLDVEFAKILVVISEKVTNLQSLSPNVFKLLPH